MRAPRPGERGSSHAWRAVSLAALLVLTSSPQATSQDIGAENGAWMPTRGEVRFFLVFAQVDYGNPFEHSSWPRDELPVHVEEYFSPDGSSTLCGPGDGFDGCFAGLFTDYYYQMSLGNYVVLGDYFPQLVTVSSSGTAADKRDAVFATLNASTPIHTANGYDLDAFDLWGTAPPGVSKPNVANDRLDALFIIWRNFDAVGNREELWSPMGTMTHGRTVTIGSKSGLDVFAQQTVGIGRLPIEVFGIVVHEYMHALFGGNHWHTGSGAEEHTFQAPTGTFSMTAHSPSVAAVACGWDRYHLRWKHPRKQLYLSAGEGTSEVGTDLSIRTHPVGGTFVLRDFITTGDALRIRLPHLEWSTLGDKKNQYLWIENHQRVARVGTPMLAALGESTLDTNALAFHPCQDRWSPGLHAYVQVGKDIRGQDLDGNGLIDAVERDVYSSSHRHPNGLGSHLFPLPADGRHDEFWRLEHVVRDDRSCLWNHAAFPAERASSLPNPFTGHSDLYWQLDSDAVSFSAPSANAPAYSPLGDGRLTGRADPVPGSSGPARPDYVEGAVVFDGPELGDSTDLFRLADGTSELAIDTNPATATVYTHRSQWNHESTNEDKPTGDDSDWENRTIRLNGVSVRILEENIDGHGAVRVHVRWDDYHVGRDSRWTGDIALRNDPADPYSRVSTLHLGSSRTIHLDRGLSPTQMVAHDVEESYEMPQDFLDVYPPGSWQERTRLFTDPTVLTVEAGTRLHLGPASKIRLHNHSRLVVEAGAELLREPFSEIVDDVASSEDDIEIRGVELRGTSAYADTYIRADLDARKNDNYGRQGHLAVGTTRSGAADGMQALVEFYLGALEDGDFARATLELTVHSVLPATGHDPLRIDVHRIVTPWREGNGYEGAPVPSGATDPDSAFGVAWEAIDENNDPRPEYYPAVEASATVTASGNPRGTVVRFEITHLVRQWMDHEVPNHGLLLRTPTSASGFRQVSFGAGEGLFYDLPDAVPGPLLVLAPGPQFVRGDCDGDGRACSGVTDALALLQWAFFGTAVPPCMAACDSNGSGAVEAISDAVYGLQYCFSGTAPPPSPHPECGPGNATDTAIGCATPPTPCL